MKRASGLAGLASFSSRSKEQMADGVKVTRYVGLLTTIRMSAEALRFSPVNR